MSLDKPIELMTTALNLLKAENLFTPVQPTLSASNTLTLLNQIRLIDTKNIRRSQGYVISPGFTQFSGTTIKEIVCRDGIITAPTLYNPSWKWMPRGNNINDIIFIFRGDNKIDIFNIYITEY